jgi:hypothetical protein
MLVRHIKSTERHQVFAGVYPDAAHPLRAGGPEVMHMGETDQSVTTPTTLAYERNCADFGANHPLIEIYPREIVRRRAVGWRGISMELIQPATHDRIGCRFNGPTHLLVANECGIRHEGETFVQGAGPGRAEQ